MHLFNYDDKLKKYNTTEEIINDYFKKRLELYETRKKQQLDVLIFELKILSNKARFIQEVLDDEIDIRKKKLEVINNLLLDKNYDKIESNYDYLIKLPMDSVTEENVTKLLKNKKSKEEQVNILSKKSAEDIWLEDLTILKDNYYKYKKYREGLQCGEYKKNEKNKLKLKISK